MAASTVEEAPLSLALGWPSPELFPMGILGDWQARGTDGQPRLEQALSYGNYQGDPAFREAFGNFLSNIQESPVTSDSLFVTTGAGAALDFICTLFCKAGDIVLVEPASYNLAQWIFRDHGLQVLGVPLREMAVNGPASLKDVPQALGGSVKLIYVTPTFGNPTTESWMTNEKQGVVDLARAWGCVIVSDEVYRPLAFDPIERSAEPLCALDPAGEVVFSLGSFTKFGAPGLRLGWIQIGDGGRPPPLMTRLIETGLVENAGSLNQFSSALIAPGIASGYLARHLGFLNEALRERAELLVGSLREYFSESDLSFADPKGGFYVWAKFARFAGQDEDSRGLMRRFHALCNDRGVDFFPGEDFLPADLPGGLPIDGERLAASIGQHARLSFSFLEPEQTRESVRRLASAYRDFQRHLR